MLPQLHSWQSALRTRLVLALIAVLLFGCGAEDTRDLGDWTLWEDGLRVADTLLVDETETFYFGVISDLAVTSKGRMVIADREAKNVKVLAADGSLVDTLGGPGQGPGEFEALRSVQVARGDSLYTYDFRRSRLTVFAPDPPYSVARMVTVSRDLGFVTELIVLDDQFVGSSGSSPDLSKGGVTTPPPRIWRLVSDDGVPGDTLLQTRGQDLAVATAGRAFRARPVPFARTTQVKRGPDGRLYTGWSDSLRIQAHAADGTSETIVDVPTSPVPVTEAERDSILNDVGSDLRSIMASAIPETKPAFTDFVVADDGRLWVKRPTVGHQEESQRWWRLAPDSRTIHEGWFPADVDIEVVMNGKVYGTTITENGGPAVVRYDIQVSS